MNRPNKGFTLMELLIVIGVLGILAVGLLAAIDPFEQLKKARDTNNRGAATEFLQASQRYYATHGYLPWTLTDASGDNYVCSDTAWTPLRPTTSVTSYPYDAVSLAATGSAGIVQGVTDCIGSTLGVDGEIKTTFFQGLATTLYVTSGSPTRVGVCFAPEAKSNRTDSATKYYLTGDKASGFKISDTPGTGQSTCPNVNSDYCLQCFE